jgi:Protein of unknown function (DUF3761)
MKRRVSVLLFTFALFSQLLDAQAQAASQSQNSASATASHAPQPKPTCTDNGTYVNSKGQTVKRPENCSSAPQWATAQCHDGTYSFSKSRRGTCSHRGGVAKWL